VDTRNIRQLNNVIEFPDYRRKKEPFDLGSLGQMSRSLGSNVPKPFPTVAFSQNNFLLPSLRKVCQGVLELLIGNSFSTFDPVTPKSIEFICYPGRMCVPSLRKVGQGIGALLIGNGFGIFGTFDPGDLDL